MGQGDQRGGDCGGGDGGMTMPGCSRRAVRRGGFGWSGRQGGDQRGSPAQCSCDLPLLVVPSL